MVTEMAKVLRALIKDSPQTCSQLLAATTLRRRGVQHALTRLEKEGLVGRTKATKGHKWYALTDKGIGDRRGKSLGSQTALAHSHSIPSVRKRRLQNLRHLKFDRAGNFIPTVRATECTLAQVWTTARFSSCADSD